MLVPSLSSPRPQSRHPPPPPQQPQGNRSKEIVIPLAAEAVGAGAQAWRGPPWGRSSSSLSSPLGVTLKSERGLS